MKILLSAYACEPGKGSEPAVGWNWLLSIAELGHEVAVITRENNRPAIEAQLASHNLSVDVIYFDLPVWFRNFKHWPGGLYLYYLLWQFGAYRHARRLHRRNHFDVVHHITFVTFRQPSFMGYLGIPFIFGPVGGGETSPRALRRGMTLVDRMRESLRDTLIHAARFDPLMRRTFSKATLIACTTHETLRHIPSRFQSRCIVLPAIGATPSPETVPQPSNSITFLFVGRLLYWKGLHLVIRAMPEVLRRLPQARLTVIGDGNDASWLKRVAEDCGVTGHIDWLSHLPYDKMTDAYRGHTALVFPSLHDSGGMVVLESLASQLPVICLALGGPGAFVDSSCGIVLDPANHTEASLQHSLAAAMISIAENLAYRAALASNCSARLLHFTWAETAQKLYSAFYATNRVSASVIPSDGSSDERIRIHTQAR